MTTINMMSTVRMECHRAADTPPDQLNAFGRRDWRDQSAVHVIDPLSIGQIGVAIPQQWRRDESPSRCDQRSPSVGVSVE
jgi:hypothetical protein